jgi:hypothetical protein
MHHHSGGLIDHREIFIFVKNIQRDRFRRYGHGLRWGDFDFDKLPGFEPVGRLRGDSIHANTTLGDQRLKTRAAEIGGVGGEKAVEAHACVFILYSEG